MFVTLYETAEVHFCLFGTNGLYVKADKEKFIAAGSPCRQNLKRFVYTGQFCRATSCTKFRACSNDCDLSRYKSQ